MGGYLGQSSDNDDVQIKGATDSTLIGNVTDRLKVEASIKALSRISPSFTGTSVRIDDMNVANGGVARDTAITSAVAYTQIYSYTGSGHLFAFLITLEGNLVGADPFNIKLEIDGTTVFEISTLDVGTATLWNLATTNDENAMGLSLANNSFRYATRYGGLYYATGLKIYTKRALAGSKRFRAGLVHLTKDT